MFKRNGRFSCMGMLKVFFFVTLASMTAIANADLINLGTPLSETEINQFSITIFPDGTNLPAGTGSVEQGQGLYKNQCLTCHGKNGIEGPAARLAGMDGWFEITDPLRILRIKKYPVLLISVGGLWPHATSIFDYIRRAMPHYAPKSLSNDEVYALTAYLLYLNELVDEEKVLDKNNILDIKMPGEVRSVSDWISTIETINTKHNAKHNIKHSIKHNTKHSTKHNINSEH